MGGQSMYNGEAFLFAIYCHKDKTAVQAILKILTAYEGYHIYYDQNIPAGENWRRFVSTHMSESEGVLIFLSEAFMHSKGCQSEMNFIHFLPDINIIPFTLDDKPLTEEMAWLKENHTIKPYRDIDTFLKELERVPTVQKCRKNKTDKTAESPVQNYDAAPSASNTTTPFSAVRNTPGFISMEDFISMTGKPNTVTKIITPTEEKYKILMLGSKVPGKPGGAVVVHCGNFDYAKKISQQRSWTY